MTLSAPLSPPRAAYCGPNRAALGAPRAARPEFPLVPRESGRAADVLAFTRPVSAWDIGQAMAGKIMDHPAMGGKAVIAPAASETDITRTILPRPCAAQPSVSVPFASVEEAWYWTLAALRARREGGGAAGRRVARPCDPDDVMRCLDTLYRRRRIDLVHARILRIWGERRRAPNPARPAERGDWRLWREAMERLDWPLRVKGIVA